MSSTLVTLLFDCALAVLLAVTIAYCARLSKRIKILQDGRSEFASMLAQFDMATNRAVSSVNDLHTVSKKITDALQLKIDKANFLADDLAFLIEKSNKLVLQLEQLKLQAEGQIKAKPFVEEKPRPKPESLFKLMGEAGSVFQDEKLVPRTSAERELLAALKGR